MYIEVIRRGKEKCMEENVSGMTTAEWDEHPSRWTVSKSRKKEQNRLVGERMKSLKVHIFNLTLVEHRLQFAGAKLVIVHVMIDGVESFFQIFLPHLQ